MCDWSATKAAKIWQGGAIRLERKRGALVVSVNHAGEWVEVIHHGADVLVSHIIEPVGIDCLIRQAQAETIDRCTE